MGLISKMISKWFSSEEEDATEKTFGSVIPLRVGNGFSVSPVFFTLLSDESIFKQLYKPEEFAGLTIETILSFDLGNTTVYRLHFTQGEHIVQIQEINGGSDVEIMVLANSGITGFNDKDEYDQFIEMMGSDEIEDEDGNLFEALLKRVNFTEKMEATLKPKYDAEPEIEKTMSLFDRQTENSVDYILYDADVNDWFAEHYVGVIVPREEITII
jgi:hypothetical protein